jgi:hypothetical protein
MKKLILIAASAFILSLGGCLGVATAGSYSFNGYDMGSHKNKYLCPYPDQEYPYQDPGQYQNQQREQSQHEEQDRLQNIRRDEHRFQS